MGLFLKVKFLVPLLLLVMFATMLGSSLGDSGIEDERPHIVAGYSYLTTGDFRINPEHPPLIKDIIALPLIFNDYVFPFAFWGDNLNEQWELGRQFLYDMGNNPDSILFWSRLPIILLSLFLGYLVYRWARQLYGEKAGLFALTLYVFDVNIIAHSRFVTTDLGIMLAFVLHLYILYNFLKEPTKKGLMLTGLTFGIVLITKFSAALLLPMYFLIFILEMIRRREKVKEKVFSCLLSNRGLIKRALGYIGTFAVISLIGFVVMYLFYIPHVWNMSPDLFHSLVDENLPSHSLTPLIHSMGDNAFLLPIAQYLLGFAMVSGHVESGHTIFFMGEVANSFQWFYPIVTLIKTPLVTLMLVFATIYLFTRKYLKDRDYEYIYTKLYLLVPGVVFFSTAMYGSLNLGIRHVLPMFPFLFIFMADIVNKVSMEKAKDVFKGKISTIALGSLAFVLLLAWYILGSLRTYPHYLSYFNESIGGSKNGITWVADSNLDWGQDLRRLVQYVEDNDIEKISVDYFGSGDVEHYLGDKGVQWKADYGKPISGYFAISASYYSQATADILEGKEIVPKYDWLKDFEPLANIGNSIFIFDLDK